MPNNVIGTVQLQLPIIGLVGSQYVPRNSDQSAAAPVAGIVPPPFPLTINGRLTASIDVRTMGPSDVVNVINNAAISGVVASLDGQGRLVITGVTMLRGNPNLRAILGIQDI
jgi:hypothetical protein